MDLSHLTFVEGVLSSSALWLTLNVIFIRLARRHIRAYTAQIDAMLVTMQMRAQEMTPGTFIKQTPQV